MNTIYIGVDFHARQQTICYLTTETGELVTAELKHEPKTGVRTFYEQSWLVSLDHLRTANCGRTKTNSLMSKSEQTIIISGAAASRARSTQKCLTSNVAS
jgi:hypothetical protein